MPGVIWHPSPNHGPRRDGLQPELVVLHFTGMADTGAALERLCDPAAEVSAHYLISGSGQVWHLVQESRRAWHAGAGGWQGRGDVNSRSVGIELCNPGDRPFAAPQMHALEALLRSVMARWNIRAKGVIGHSDMAPERKFDPGPRFDWCRLARQQLAIWPDPQAGQAPAPPLVQSLDRIGYPPAPAPDRLRAFRARFRPAAAHSGRDEDAQDRAIAANVAVL
ncbi:N-acetylmuramoyl-L-alanine amidase [Rhabdonatronobacter sediminivivens]|nr:N-acetylmuramoyl-L-alanine amidase [Rhabdonatronobacter sediminivivens]